MERLIYSKGDDHSIDSSCLQNTVRKLVSNLCETLIIYRTQLRIEGTVGITIDEERVIVLHFGENIGKTPCLSTDDSSGKTQEPDRLTAHDIDHADEPRQKAFRESLEKNDTRAAMASSAYPGIRESLFFASSHVAGEAKTRAQTLAVNDTESESEMAHDQSPIESVRTKVVSENETSHSEAPDSLLFASRSLDEGPSCFGGRDELEGATLLDMTTDILSNLFNSSGYRDVSLNNYYDRGRMGEQSQGCKLRQGSAIEALRRIYCKQFTGHGKEAAQHPSDLEFHPNAQDHVASGSTESKGKNPCIAKRECNQSQALLRELLFQKANPVAGVSSAGTFGLQQPSSKRRRTDKSTATFAELLMQRSSSIGSLDQNVKTSVHADDARSVGQREGCSPELGHSGFPAGIPFDQDADGSKYKFSQLLFSLVDSRRNSVNNLSSAFAEQRPGGSSSKLCDSGVYPEVYASEASSIKKEISDSEYEAS